MSERDRQSRLRRRQVLAGTALSAVGGLAGCLGGDSGDSSGCPSGEISVEGPDGTTHCVEPVEYPQQVSEYYNYGGGQNTGASTQDGLSTNDATVLFVYRNADSGDRSLVVIHGDATVTSEGGGRAPMTFEGVSGYEWRVQDGPAGTGSGDRDPYQTADGAFGDSESVIWAWDDTKTDGGAFGPLGETFDVTATLETEGTVGQTTTQRRGLDRVLLVDGADLGSAVELATIEESTGDVSISVSDGSG